MGPTPKIGQRLAEESEPSMPVSVRYFLFPEESDPLRLAQRLVDGLIQGNDEMPQYADTKTFDEDGAIREDLQEAMSEAMSLSEASSTSEKVVSLRPQLKRKRFDEKYRWEPSSADMRLGPEFPFPSNPAAFYRGFRGATEKCRIIFPDEPS
jgi:hypothetical protein